MRKPLDEWVRTSRFGKRRLAAAGAAVHVVMLAAPLASLGLLGAAVRDGPTRAFAALSTGFVVAEVLSQIPERARPATGASGHPAARRAGSLQRDRALAAVTGLALMALFVTGVLERAASAAAGSLVLQGCGGAALALGIALRCAAIRTLGPFFVPEARVLPGQPLVDTGVYRLVRHPSETGLLAAGIGAAALLESRIALAVWALVLVPSSLARARREDQVLGRAFPDAHARYAARVGALLPRAAKRGSRAEIC